MGSKRSDDVLVALIGSTASHPLAAKHLVERLAGSRAPQRASDLLKLLLDLEAAGLLTVHRDPPYRFSLTPAGARAAYEAASGQVIEATVLVIDLVGFTAYTESYGDAAARDASREVRVAAEDELRPVGGRVVKSTGDGVLAVVPPEVDVSSLVAAVRARLQNDEHRSWSLRAGAHGGRPVEHDGDIFGADVNLAARLCEIAEPDQLVMTAGTAQRGNEQTDGAGSARSAGFGDSDGAHDHGRRGSTRPEVVDIRGLEGPIAVRRVVLGAAT